MPRQIVYAGYTPEVVVPAYRLTATAGEPIEVPDEVADDLTAGGTSAVWLAVDAKGRPVPAPAPATVPIDVESLEG